MLPPYQNIPRYHHHHHCVSRDHQEPPLQNPTARHMPVPEASSVDEYVQFFPAEMYHQETLEAVLRQPATAPVPVPEEERGPGNEAPADGGGGGIAHGGGSVGVPRKRPFRTDRHSKIRTAQGVRDRRMRLSVGVARDFFALQDLLGFDKASKTVDWLLTQSKPAIERLSDAAAPGAAVPQAAAVRAPAWEKGDAASSSSTDCFRDARGGARAGERTTERMKSIDGDVVSEMVLMAERGGNIEHDWFMSEATAAAAIEQPVAADGSMDYYYQYYQLEEMMRAATTEEY